MGMNHTGMIIFVSWQFGIVQMNASLKKKLDCESEMKIFICGGKMSKHWYDEWEITGVTFDTSDNLNKKFFKPVYIMPDGDIVACDGTHDFNYDPNKEIQIVPKESIPFYGKPTEPAVYRDDYGNCVDVDGSPLGMKWDDFMEKRLRMVNK
jgi:hypothetical protein